VDSAFLIVGLGNPGGEYAQTRHNAGFMVLEQFAEWRRASWKMEERFQARLARAEFRGKRLVLCQPQTYMNLSGIAVQAVSSFYKVPVGQVIVVVDDADLPLGTVRMRPSGSAGGHHGLESIEQHLGTRQYARIRIGIGRGADGARQIKDYVLSRFSKSELALLKAILDRACSQIECWLTEGAGKAMNEFNGVIEAPTVKES
jgi:peptidyl-tRNA hydrolase, PTH1 family